MGWGNPPHEGYTARLLDDGSLTSVWSAETNERATGSVVVVCSCSWRGGVYRDHSEADEERAYHQWWTYHMAPMVEPDPDRLLVLGTDAGGVRHFLAGEPVHAGTGLELRLTDDRWVRVRYEWDWDPEHRPRAYLALGGRGEPLGYEPAPVSFALPKRAELRWPR